MTSADFTVIGHNVTGKHVRQRQFGPPCESAKSGVCLGMIAPDVSSTPLGTSIDATAIDGIGDAYWGYRTPSNADVSSGSSLSIWCWSFAVRYANDSISRSTCGSPQLCPERLRRAAIFG